MDHLGSQSELARVKSMAQRRVPLRRGPPVGEHIENPPPIRVESDEDLEKCGSRCSQMHAGFDLGTRFIDGRKNAEIRKDDFGSAALGAGKVR